MNSIKKGMLLRYYFLVLLFLFPFVLSAQYDTLHVIPPTAYSFLNNQTELIFSTESTIPVNVEVFKSDGTFLFDTTVVKNDPIRHWVENSTPSSELLPQNVVMTDEALFIYADADVAVNLRNSANDAYLPDLKGNFSLNSKGTFALGTDFRFIGYRQTNFVYGITAVENGTTVTIDNAASQTILLNAGESILLTSISPGNGIGTHVTANKQIAMSSGAALDSPGGCGDPIADQLIPVNHAGTEHLVIKGQGNLTLEQFTIVATQDNTSYTINGGTPSVLVNAGDFITTSNGTLIGDRKFIESDKPVLIAQGTGLSCEAGQSILSPLRCTGSKLIQTKDYLGLNFEGYVLSHPQYPPKLNGVQLTSPITISPDWELYAFDSGMTVGAVNLLFESEKLMHVWMVQSGGGMEMFSFLSGFKKNPVVTVKVETSNNENEMQEGCEHFQIVINRDEALEEDIIHFSTSGTSANGTDYSGLPASDTLIYNIYNDTVPVTTLFTNDVEGNETIELHITWEDHCTGEEYSLDTVLVLTDYYAMNHSEIDSINVCVETDVSFQMSSTISNGVPPYSYLWSNDLGIQNSTTESVSNLVSNLNVYHLNVMDQCQQTISVPFSIYEQCPVSAPNVITANGDNTNDYFLIKNLEDYDQVRLRVINRWGNVVYENNHYDNSFNGESNKGKELTSGVYFYIVEVESNKYVYSDTKMGANTLTGFMHIIKE